jgi:hypothetical protein
MVSSVLISDFTAGELSSWLWGQDEQPVYRKGASVMSNMVPKQQGGFYKRPGTLVLGHTQGDVAARLVPFVISQGTVYVFEFTNLLVRVWKNGVWMGAGANIVTTYTAAEISNLQFYPFFPDLFITNQNHAPARIHWVTPDTFDLAGLTFPTQTLTFTGTSTNGAATIPDANTNLLPAEATWFLTGPGIVAGTYIETIVPTTGTNPLVYTVTMSANAGVGAGAGTFTLTLQPRVFGSAGNYPRACAVISQRLWLGNTAAGPQEVWESIVGIWDASDANHTAVGMAWSDVSTFSVPVMQTNANGTPTTTPPTFIPTPSFQDQVNDEDAGDYTLNSETDDEVYWLRNVQDILVGSASGEWIIPGTANPNTIQASQISNIGDSPIPPTAMAGGVIFVQRLARRVYKLQWQSVYIPYVPPQNLNFFSDQMFLNNPITAYDIQRAPDNLLWFLRTDGTLGVLHYDMAYGTLAWWNFVTTGTVLSVCVVPGTDFQGLTDRDIVYLCVQRGASVFIEQVATPFWTDQRQAIFSDCATYRYNAVAFTTMTVDTGLNGRTLEVVADGVYIGTAVPAGGVLTLPGGVSANYAVAGLNYTSTMTTMPLVPPSQSGTSQLKKKSVPKARFRVLNTLYFKCGQFTAPNAGGLSPLSTVRMGDSGIGGVVIDSTHPSAKNPIPYSGYCRSSILEALREDAFLTVYSDLPLSCSITAIVPDVADEEDAG